MEWAAIAGVIHAETSPEDAADGGDLSRGASTEL